MQDPIPNAVTTSPSSIPVAFPNSLLINAARRKLRRHSKQKLPPPRDAINFLKDKHNITVVANYEINFQQAICPFLSHPVFNPFYLTQVPL